MYFLTSPLLFCPLNYWVKKTHLKKMAAFPLLTLKSKYRSSNLTLSLPLGLNNFLRWKIKTFLKNKKNNTKFSAKKSKSFSSSRPNIWLCVRLQEYTVFLPTIWLDGKKALKEEQEQAEKLLIMKWKRSWSNGWEVNLQKTEEKSWPENWSRKMLRSGLIIPNSKLARDGLKGSSKGINISNFMKFSTWTSKNCKAPMKKFAISTVNLPQFISSPAIPTTCPPKFNPAPSKTSLCPSQAPSHLLLLSKLPTPNQQSIPTSQSQQPNPTAAVVPT